MSIFCKTLSIRYAPANPKTGKPSPRPDGPERGNRSVGANSPPGRGRDSFSASPSANPVGGIRRLVRFDSQPNPPGPPPKRRARLAGALACAALLALPATSLASDGGIGTAADCEHRPGREGQARTARRSLPRRAAPGQARDRCRQRDRQGQGLLHGRRPRCWSASCYDCSGAVSYALGGRPLESSTPRCPPARSRLGPQGQRQLDHGLRRQRPCLHHDRRPAVRHLDDRRRRARLEQGCERGLRERLQSAARHRGRL